jgi:ATP-dependent DNA helicase RecQ
VRALQYVEEQGLVELRASEPRLSFARVDRRSADAPLLVAELVQRFHRREEMEVARLQHVVGLVEHSGCQVNALVGYFGQERDAPCGHCTFCQTGRPQHLPPAPAPPPIEGLLDVGTFSSLCAGHPQALGEPRQQARFLCGLSSPALVQARLSRHPLFGALESLRFDAVLAWCRRRAGGC